MSTEKQTLHDDHLLIYAPVALHRKDGVLFLEDQACNGLRRWADNFSFVTAMFPLSEEPPAPGWSPVSILGDVLERVRILPLPIAYRPGVFLKALPATLARISAAIDEADYLCFAIGGLFGDWGAVSAFAAHRHKRPFAVWTDRVESERIWRLRHKGGWKHRLHAYLTAPPMSQLERAVVRRADLGLFHGQETFDAYAPYCGGTSAVVHDIHIGKQDHIPPDQLVAKIDRSKDGPLRICYVGRADAMKGALDWVEVLGHLAEAGVAFQATWLGDGPDRPQMIHRIAELGLQDRVSLPGFSSDRTAILTTLREVHILLFCHKTPESPRCLIEALICGAPIVGYDGAFARELVASHGGGLLVPLNDIAELATAVASLDKDRKHLATMITAAALDGAPFDDVSVFKHRSALIKKYLPLE